MCCVVWWRVSSEVFVGTVRSGVDKRVKEKEGTSGCGEEESAGEEGGKALQRRRRRWRRQEQERERETEMAIKYITGEK